MDSRTPRQMVPEPFAAQLRALFRDHSPHLGPLLAAYHAARWKTPALAAALGMNASAVSKRIERAKKDPELEAMMASGEIVIPKPEKIHAMLGGKQLPKEKIAELLEMQRPASRVNGALQAGHPDRIIGEMFSRELYRLVTEDGISPYYLAQVLGVSHRAVTSRLERHGYRLPPPSVAGTPSGFYYGRKIGDPGEGAPRISREQRAELRQLWRAQLEGRRGAAAAMAAKLTEYLDQGFSLANLAQTMSNHDLRVRFTALQDVLGRAQPKVDA
jgi:biotin operon repressor